MKREKVWIWDLHCKATTVRSGRCHATVGHYHCCAKQMRRRRTSPNSATRGRRGKNTCSQVCDAKADTFRSSSFVLSPCARGAHSCSSATGAPRKGCHLVGSGCQKFRSSSAVSGKNHMRAGRMFFCGPHVFFPHHLEGFLLITSA